MEKSFEFQCKNCGKICKRKNCYHPRYRPGRSQDKFCDKICFGKFNAATIELNCAWCNKKVIRSPSEHEKSITGNAFCNRSCAAFYNNKTKKKSRRSKAEILLFSLIKENFSNLEILPNDKTMLEGYEIDIAIPSINIGIEWNGIVHFEPIYGQEKLNKIQGIDVKKREIAKTKNINLITIADTGNFRESYVKEAFIKISNILNSMQDQGTTKL